MTFVFIRHTSVAVPRGTCYGSTDVEVAETFLEEAAAVRQRLPRLPFDRVYTSPLTRAKALADYCGFPDAVRDERLREFDFGEWEMQSYDDLYQHDPRFADWCDHYLDRHAPAGDSFRSLIDRVNQFIQEQQQMGGGPVACFCHGGVLASALILAGEVLPEQAMQQVPPYGSVIQLTL